MTGLGEALTVMAGATTVLDETVEELGLATGEEVRVVKDSVEELSVSVL